MAFCKDFNARTQKEAGKILPVVIDVYQDKSFTFITLQPPVAEMIKTEAKIEKGSGVPNRDKVGKLTDSQVEKIELDIFIPQQNQGVQAGKDHCANGQKFVETIGQGRRYQPVGDFATENQAPDYGQPQQQIGHNSSRTGHIPEGRSLVGQG